MNCLNNNFETVLANKNVGLRKNILFSVLIYTCFVLLSYMLFLTDTFYTDSVYETLVETKGAMIKKLVWLNYVKKKTLNI